MKIETRSSKASMLVRVGRAIRRPWLQGRLWLKRHPRFRNRGVRFLVLVAALGPLFWILFVDLEVQADFDSLELRGLSDFKATSGPDFGLPRSLIAQIEDIECAGQPFWDRGGARLEGISLSIPDDGAAPCDSIQFTTAWATDGQQRKLAHVSLVPSGQPRCALLALIGLSSEPRPHRCAVGAGQALTLTIERRDTAPTDPLSTLVENAPTREISGMLAAPLIKFGLLGDVVCPGKHLDGLGDVKLVRKVELKGVAGPILSAEIQIDKLLQLKVDSKSCHWFVLKGLVRHWILSDVLSGSLKWFFLALLGSIVGGRLAFSSRKKKQEGAA